MELEVPKDVAEEVVESLEEKSQKYENVLQSFRSNGLTDTKEYREVQQSQDELVEKIENIEQQIDEEETGLGDLFG